MEEEEEQRKAKFDASAYQENPEVQAEKLTLDKMIKFDKVFLSVMNHCKKMLGFGKLDLNRHIE